MKITVAIPCYNLEDRIAACLESIFIQDYQDIEVLIIDDGSTDDSVEVVNNLIKCHPERDIRLIVNEKNLGLNKVRNIAIREAHGEFLFFVDGDDTIEPSTLSLLYRRMAETHVDVVCGCHRKKGFDGNTYIVKQFPEDTIKGDYAYATYIGRYIHGYFYQGVLNRLYRLDFLRSNNICCATHYPIHGDCLFTFKVVLSARSLSFIHDVTYNYCDVPTSICHRKADENFFQVYRDVTMSVIDTYNEFKSTHKGLQVPYGIRFLLNYVCLTNGLLKKALESDVDVRKKKGLLKWLKEQYMTNGMNWGNIAGTYNKLSYLILMSPFPYPLFRLYMKNLKKVAKIVNYLSAITRS